MVPFPAAYCLYVKYYLCKFVRRSVLKCRSTVSMVRARRSSVVVRRTKTRANVVGGSLPVRTHKEQKTMDETSVGSPPRNVAHCDAKRKLNAASRACVRGCMCMCVRAIVLHPPHMPRGETRKRQGLLGASGYTKALNRQSVTFDVPNRACVCVTPFHAEGEDGPFVALSIKILKDRTIYRNARSYLPVRRHDLSFVYINMLRIKTYV